MSKWPVAEIKKIKHTILIKHNTKRVYVFRQKKQDAGQSKIIYYLSQF